MTSALVHLRRPVTYLRVLYLLIGSAITLSLGLLIATLVVIVSQYGMSWLTVLAATGGIVGVVALVGLVPAARQVEGVAAESLLGVSFADGTPGPAVRAEERARSAVWFAVHVVAGGLVVLSLAVVLPFGLSFLTAPFRLSAGQFVTSWEKFRVQGGAEDAWMPVVGLVLLLVAIVGPAVLGAAVARAAPPLLGPSSVERLRRLETESARLAQRNRIAQELHDSLGHALSVVTLQAGAARRRLQRPGFDAADEALDAIESTARLATEQLDVALGLLRDGVPPTGGAATPPGLGGLDDLLTATRRAGLRLTAAVGADLGSLPPVVSQEAYRIVQEALTNALRHSADGSAWLELARPPGRLVVRVTNPARPGAPVRAGRGVRGMRERARALGGTVEATSTGGSWTVVAELPAPPPAEADLVRDTS